MGIGVEASDVSKTYGGKQALSGVGIGVKAGGIFAVLGPSGSGKSTLLRLLNLLERPDGGEIRFVDGGKSVHDGETMRRRMTLLLQRPVMLKNTVYGNVAYGLRLRGTDEREIEEKVRASLEQIGLEGFERRRASTLSGGEMQRVAFARAAVLRPELLLLDEFTANLDPPNIKMLEKAVKDYRESTGCTVILVSHNPFQAQRLAERCIFLLDGKVLGEGRIADVKETPDENVQAFFRGENV